MTVENRLWFDKLTMSDPIFIDREYLNSYELRFIARRFFFCIGIVLLVFYLAVFARFIGRTLYSKKPFIAKMDPLPSQLESDRITLSGKADVKNSQIDVIVGNRICDTILTNDSGGFCHTTIMPYRDTTLRMQLHSGDVDLPDRDTVVSLKWKKFIEITHAYLKPGNPRLLWIAGNTIANQKSVMYDIRGKRYDTLQSDRYGIFQLTIDCKSTRDSTKLVPGNSLWFGCCYHMTDIWCDSTATAVLKQMMPALSGKIPPIITKNEFPLHRSLRIDLPKPLTPNNLNKVQQGNKNDHDSRIDSVRKSHRLEYTWTVILPRHHPAAQKLSAGILPVGVFLRRITGATSFIPEDTLSFFNQKNSDRPTFLKAPIVNFTTNDEIITVTITGWKYLSSENEMFTLFDQTGIHCPGSFVSGCNDSIVLNKNGHRCNFFSGIPPILQDNQKIVWTFEDLVDHDSTVIVSVSAVRETFRRDRLNRKDSLSTILSDDSENYKKTINRPNRDKVRANRDKVRDIFLGSRKCNSFNDVLDAVVDWGKRYLPKFYDGIVNFIPFIILLFSFLYKYNNNGSFQRNLITTHTNDWKHLFTGTLFLSILYALPLLQELFERTANILFCILELLSGATEITSIAHERLVVRILAPVFWLLVAIVASSPLFLRRIPDFTHADTCLHFRIDHVTGGVIAVFFAVVLFMDFIPPILLPVLPWLFAILLCTGAASAVTELFSGYGIILPLVNKNGKMSLYAYALLCLWIVFSLRQPFVDGNTIASVGGFSAYVDKIKELFFLGLGWVFIAAVWKKADTSSTTELPPDLLFLGRCIYVVFLVNHQIWFNIPLACVMAIVVARFVLFASGNTTGFETIGKDRQQELNAALRKKSGEMIATIARRSLLKKLEKGELDYLKNGKQLSKIETSVSADWSTDKNERQSSIDLLSHGFGTVRENVRACLCDYRNLNGCYLSILLLFIALCLDIPSRQINLSYPWLFYMVEIIRILGRWLMVAFFFAVYLSYIPGKSGLTKGITMACFLIAPRVVFLIVSMQFIPEFRTFAIDTSLTFLFCSLLGLFAIDYRMLKKNGFHFRDLRYIHPLPSLYAYGSTVLAAIGTAIVTLLANEASSGFKGVIDLLILGK